MFKKANWEKVKFIEAVSINPRESLAKGSLAKKVSMSDVIENTKNIKNYNVTEYKSGPKFRQNDTLFARITPSLENGKTAKVNILEEDELGFGSTEFIVMRAKPGITDDDFVYYLSRWDGIRDPAIKSMTGTSGRQRVQNAVFEDLIINLPSLSEQKKIANILSSFDDKIENNNAIIANLEEQAQAIFKSWFVDFEPFQDEEFVNSDLGEIPKNWKVGKLGDSKLGKLKTSGIEAFEGEKIYLATADVEGTSINNTETIITYDNRPSRANMQPSVYSIWFAKMKESRKLILVSNDDEHLLNNMVFSTGFAGIQCDERSIYYLWEFLKTEYFDNIKNQYSNGTTMQAINNRNINRILIIIPPEDILMEFNLIMKPLNDYISYLRKINTRLSKIRDTLLPKLMSGEIRVEEAIEVK